MGKKAARAGRRAGEWLRCRLLANTNDTGWGKKKKKEGGEEYNLCKVRENNPQGASENVSCQLKTRKKHRMEVTGEDGLHANRQKDGT